jgi:hypothetical protein
MAQTTNTPGVLEDWLDPQYWRHPGPDAHIGPDTDGEYLREISARRLAGATETDLLAAVKRARDRGWSWTPIAISLHTTRADAVARFARSVRHPVSRRAGRAPS